MTKAMNASKPSFTRSFGAPFLLDLTMVRTAGPSYTRTRCSVPSLPLDLSAELAALYEELRCNRSAGDG
jgi:hypothetical protein